MTIRCDMGIVGAGPAGYVAALRAAQLGAEAVLIEKETVGGVCLNSGCIPTKALLRTARVLELSRGASAYGVIVPEAKLDWPAAQKRKNRIVRRLTGGVEFLLKNAGVCVLRGTAHFIAPSVLEVATEDGVKRVEAGSYLLATGSRPTLLPVPGLDDPGVLDSKRALSLESLPETMLIIGGGAIGVEFATLFSACGVQVTLVELLPRLLPLMDADLGAEVERGLTKADVRVHTASKVSHIERRDGKYVVLLESESRETKVDTDKILVAVGRRPNVEDLGLDSAGVATAKTGIDVDEHMRTSAPNIYAAGDVTGSILLAHVGSKEGIVAVENALGCECVMNYATVPSCVFAHPEVASVGLSEEQAQQHSQNLKVGRFPFRASGKALAQGETEGFVKVIADGEYGQILGVHIVGPHASDLIQEGALALTLEATLDELDATVHPHPTLSEAVAEAALAAQDRALHI